MHEAHVAFSVEGLGKMGMETPVHSPHSPSRTFFSGYPSPPKVAKRNRQSNKYVMDDLEIESTATVHDIKMPLGDSSLEFFFNSKDIRNPFDDLSTKLTSQGCRPGNDHSCRVNNFFRREGSLYANWEDSSVFLHEDFSDERKPDLGWKNQSCQLDFNTAEFSRDNANKTHNFAFEESELLNRREVRKEPREFEVLESHAPYFKHLAEKNRDFITLGGARYPKVDGSWDFNQPTWSNLAKEDTTDSMSLLSEESTSSTAVRGERAKQSASNSSKLRESTRKHVTELCTSEDSLYSLTNLYSEDTGYRDKDRCYHGKNQKKWGKMPKVSRTKLAHNLKDLDRVKIELEPQCSWLFEEDYTSIDSDSDLGTFNKTSMETGFSSLECEFGSEDLFGAYPVSNSYDTFHKRSKPHAPVRCAVPFSFGSPLHYDPINPSVTESLLRKPVTHQASMTEAETPYSLHLTNSSSDTGFSALSEKENVFRDGNEKSEFQQTECENIQVPEKEVSVGNSSLLSENGTSAPSSKDKFSECMETEDETPGLIQKSEPRVSPDNAEELLPVTKEFELLPALKEIPDKLEILINDKKNLFDAKIPFPSQFGSKGNNESEKRNIGSKGESSKDPSYTVMLESYVLQLLCVQKVLKEASEKDSNKEV